MTTSSATIWDDVAATFDDASDHGLREPDVRAAWTGALLSWLPAAPAHVIDMGCGTGSITVLLAEQGYTLTGIDRSRAMLTEARHKAAAHGVQVGLVAGDAGDPPALPGSYDVVLDRHVLWALDRPDIALARWRALLRPGGRLVVIEGEWHTGAGMSADTVTTLLRPHVRDLTVQPLDDARLWGSPITDNRFAVVAAT